MGDAVRKVHFQSWHNVGWEFKVFRIVDDFGPTIYALSIGPYHFKWFLS